MLPCHIVRDLLPSYLEHLTGPETEADICEHLESCPDCRAARDAMAADLKAEKALIVTNGKDEDVVRAAANIQGVKTTPAGGHIVRGGDAAVPGGAVSAGILL